MKILSASFYMSCLVVLASCASDPPIAKVSQSQAVVATAEQLAADEHAPLELYEAQRKAAEAQRQMQEGNYELAEQLAEQAEIDAELALIKAQSAESETSANEIQRSIQVLRAELNTVQQP